MGSLNRPYSLESVVAKNNDDVDYHEGDDGDGSDDVKREPDLRQLASIA